jgi:putative MFS transporter
MAEVMSIDFMQSERGMSVASSNLILVAAGLLAVPVLLASGSMSDLYGRKRVGCSFGLLMVVGIVGFFTVARGPVMLFLFLLGTLVGQFGAWPSLDAYQAELFPTKLRAFAGSTAVLWRVPGESLSFLIGSMIVTATGGIGVSAALLAAGPLLGVVIIWRLFPETKGVDLEVPTLGTFEPFETTAIRVRVAA